MPKFLLTLIYGLSALSCFSQKNYGVSQDYYIYQNSGSAIVPLIYYETKNHWYTVARYNYEEDQTLSLQLGKKFSREGSISYSVIPLAGLLAGKFNGLSICMQTEIEAGKFSLFTEPEYCFQLKEPAEKFFYNWSEFSFQLSKSFYTGVAMQMTGTKQGVLTTEPGFLLGINVKKFELPLYFFKPSTAPGYFVVGLHWCLEK